MKKYLITLLAFVGSIVLAQADIVENYTWDLSNLTTGTQSDHNFAPVDWGHINDYWYGEPEYKVSAGSIYCGSQGDGDYGHMDLLVTPPVGGTIAMKVKDDTYYLEGSIKFYKVTKSGSTFKAGEEMTVSVPELSDEYQTITISNVPDGTYIGIRLSQVTMRDFTASRVEVESKKGLTIASVTSKNPEHIDMDADGKYTVTYAVKVKNSGTIDINPGDEGFSLSLLVGSNSDEVITVPIEQALAAGDTSDEIIVSATIDGTKYNGTVAMAIRENISDNIERLAAVKPVAYEPILTVLKDNNVLADQSTINFGMGLKAVTEELILVNDGAAELTIDVLTASEGFTVDAKAPLTIAPHDSIAVNVGIDNHASGRKSGTLTITTSDSQQFTVNLQGIIVDPNVYYEDFESSDKIPARMIDEQGQWSIQKANGATQVAYNYYKETKLITPRLTVYSGQKISVDVARYSTYSDPVLNVYYSTDRVNWILAYTLDPSEVKKREGSYWTGYVFPFTTIEIGGIPKGDYFLAFEGGYIQIDNIYGFRLAEKDHDIMYTQQNVPTEGEVNHELTLTCTIKNLGIDEADYTVYYVVGNDTIASQQLSGLAEGQDTTITLSAYPHEAGEMQGYFVFSADGYTVNSATSTINIVPESNTTVVSVGDYTSTMGSDAPVNPSWKYSGATMTYEPETIDLPAGTQITGFAFRGINDYYDIDLDNLTIWFEETTNDSESTLVSEITAKATKVYDGAYSIKADKTVSKPVNLIKVTFDEPVTYNGGMIVITATAYSRWADYAAASFASDPSAGTTFYANSTSEPVSDLSKRAENTPVLYLDVLQTSKTLAGKVTRDSEGVKGVTVKVKHADQVEYTTTTDPNGNYTLEIIQDGLTYDLYVETESGDSLIAEGLTFTEEYTQRNIELANSTTAISRPAAVPGTDEADRTYNLAGQRVGRSYKGIVIRGGKKVIQK